MLPFASCLGGADPTRRIDVPRPVTRYPTWMDARYMLVASYWRAAPVIAVAQGAQPQVPSDPNRYMIGFVNMDPVIGSVRADVTTEGAHSGWLIPDGSEVLWLTAFSHGPIVSAQWYIISAFLPRVMVYECILR